MTNTQRAWQSAMHETPSVSLPPSVNENEEAQERCSWVCANSTEPTPLMFSVTWSGGRIVYYAYSDLRTIDCVCPSEIIVSLYSIEKIRLSIVGRNLSDLARLLSLGRILEIHQTSSSEWFNLDEECSAIETISVETLTGP